jgi:5-methylcytosine-specific restriction enzyme B
LPPGEDELRARYQALVKARQIAFVTFHQSYAYEDFVEGLRPVTDSLEGDGPDEVTGENGSGAGFRLEPKPGIFREICQLAEVARKKARRTPSQSGQQFDLKNRKVFKMSLGRAGLQDFIYDAAIEGGYAVLGWGGELDWSDPKFENYQAVYDRWNEIEPGTSGNSGNIAQLWSFRGSMKEGDIIVVSQGNTKFRAIGIVTGPYRFDATGVDTYNHRRDVDWVLVLDEALPVETIYSRGFSQASCYRLNDRYLNQEALTRLLSGATQDGAEAEGERDVEASAPDQFVLIIDEINRANISKVFGELITLIEPDKRLGMPYELTVRLPYSRSEFGVPSNLHIVATMNTADRSIALLDTALRRRFRFRELLPTAELLDEAAAHSGIDLPGILRKLNDRIEYLFDREHQIGHAYFMGCETRAQVDAIMRDKVIPLLAEYFYEDWGRVAQVLGDTDERSRFLDRRRLSVPSGFDDNGAERHRWSVKAEFAADAYDDF